MPLHYLFGPVTKAFAEQNLHGPRQQGVCLAFNAAGDADLTIQPDDTWEAVQTRLPSGWTPDFLALWLPYTTVPACLWSAPLPRVGLAPDWPLLWHYYRRCLPACNLALTDTRGAELLAQAGLPQAHPGNLSGYERAFPEGPWPDEKRDIDILFVGNLNPAVQKERAPWLARLARLGKRWRVVIRSGAHPDSYKRLLARARIVFTYSARGKSGRRAFEAATAGALVFQEAGNRELPTYFRDRQECVYYRPDDLETLLEYYLEHEDERRMLAEAARARVGHCGFEELWAERIAALEMDGRLHPVTDRPATDGTGTEGLLARCWQALGSTHFDDATLMADLEKALADGGSPVLRNALGVAVRRQAQGRSSARAAAAVAAEQFRQVLAIEPRHAVAALNLAEALRAAGDDLAAVEAARRALDLLQKEETLAPVCLDGLRAGEGFDVLRVEWERAAWSNAGQPAAEARAKRDLLLWQLNALLAQWTGELVYYYEAVLVRPDLSFSRAALGAALVRSGRAGEALSHLRHVLADNPLHRPAARTYFQALTAAGTPEARRAFADEQHLLSRAVPAVAPPEAWFSEPRPDGKELVSIIILCCNQLDYTRICLESLLRHTRSPYELILVDNASSDGTPQYLEAIRRRPGPARVEIIRNDTNRGFPAGCNQGLARARGRYLVFLNNDTVLTPGWLDGLLAPVLADWPAVGLVGPVTNTAPDAQGIAPGYAELDGLDAFAAGRRTAQAKRTLAVRRLTGFCLLARRDLLEQVGGFDERYGTGFFDDDDLCVRAREAGYRLLVALDVYIHHFGNRTFRGLGIDTRQELLANFEQFRSKWGAEYAAGYHLPPPPAASAPQPNEEARPAPGDSTATGEEEPAVITQAPLQPVPAEPPREGVSLCMIVRNEEKHLPDCLRSVEGIFKEIIVTDTGSADRTREVAASFGARVFDFPWVDSFSAARNESLRHATGKWILWLDADDRLDADNRQRLQALLAGLGDERDAYAMKVRSVLDARRTAFRLLDQVRLFRNLPDIRWDHRIHEQVLRAVERVGGRVRWTDVVIDHVGYQDPAFRRGKLERNLRLLEMDHADRPEDAFTLFNLGWTLLDLGRTDDALRHLKHALQQTKPTCSTLRKLYHLLAVTHRQLGQKEEALRRCREGLEHFPDDAELLCEQGLLQREQGDLAAAEQSWLRLLDARRGRYFASEDVGLRGFRTWHLLAETYRARGRWTEAEVQWRAVLAERGDFEPAWQGLAELYLRQQRWPELDYLLDKVEGDGASAPKVGWLRARGQLQRREFAAARRTLAAVIRVDPRAVSPRVVLSQVLLQEGRDWAAAERALHDVLDLAPDHAETQHNLKVLRRRLGREPQPA